MQQEILKRLELIKTAISIEEEEIIELQILKFKSIEYDEDVQSILEKITYRDYGSVVLEIEAYIKRFEGVVIYEDRELQGLRLELKALERELQELTEKKSEYINDIHEFNTLYHLRLGDILKKILSLKEELLQKAIQKKKDIFDNLREEYQEIKEDYQELKKRREKKERELEDIDDFDDNYDELYEEFQELKDELDEKEERLKEKREETKEAKTDYEEDESTKEYEEVKEDREDFYREYEEVKKEDRVEINKEEKAKLKKLFRKASRLCHPDLVSDELKDIATEIMKELNSAYAKQDIQKVEEILISLESGKSFDVASDTIQDKKLIKSRITEIREMIDINIDEIETIKEDNIYKIIEKYDDIEIYFSALKESLKAEYEELQKSEVNVAEDNYWEDEF